MTWLALTLGALLFAALLYHIERKGVAPIMDAHERDTERERANFEGWGG